MQCDALTILAGCNRIVGALSWGRDLVAFGSSNVVMVYSPEDLGIVGSLNGHSDLVNCVQWVVDASSQEMPDTILLSGSSDCSTRVWSVASSSVAKFEGRQLAILEGHSTGVTSIQHSCLSNGCLLVASTSGDESVLIWESSDSSLEKWALKQQVDVGLKIQHCVAMATLNPENDRILMALGGTDCCIRLYVSNNEGLFTFASKLLGHKGWIRDLQFCCMKSGQSGCERLLLASAGGDRCVGVWLIQPLNWRETPQPQAGGLKVSSLARLAPSSQFHAGETAYSVALESLLMGHEDWVQSVAWNYQYTDGKSGDEVLQLMSTSMDHTMIIWEYDKASRIWLNKESVGDAGSSSLGYFGGVYSPDGLSLLSHGFTGALHRWKREGDFRTGAWIPKPATSGHYGNVVDMAWFANGSCLVTVSADQTTRVFGQVDGGWFEIARPQVHGHDFFGIANIPTKDGSFILASCSEEKVIRIFTGPRAFHETLLLSCGQSLMQMESVHPLGARVKALGLTNLGVYDDGATAQDRELREAYQQGNGSYSEGPELAPMACPMAVAGPPLEEHLLQNTLWPESHKLYGHGDNVYCLACDPHGNFLASASKAQSLSVATIWIWDVKTWANIDKLQAHTLTVTQMEFSPDGLHLLSGSRDRSFCIFKKIADKGSSLFQLVTRVPKAHSRIIWGVTWSADGKMFATGSRDQSVKIWRLESCEKSAHTIFCGSGVTSVAFARSQEPTSHFLAIGTEQGVVQIQTVACQGFVVSEETWRTSQNQQHGGAVRRMKWRNLSNDGQLQLASCSDDSSTRLFSFVSTQKIQIRE